VILLEQDADGAWHRSVVEGAGATVCMASAGLFSMNAEELTEGLRAALVADGARVDTLAAGLGRGLKAACVSFFDPLSIEAGAVAGGPLIGGAIAPRPLGLVLPWRNGEWTTYETDRLITLRVSKTTFASFLQAHLEASGLQAFRALIESQAGGLVRLVAVGPMARTSCLLAEALGVPCVHRPQPLLSGWQGLVAGLRNASLAQAGETIRSMQWQAAAPWFYDRLVRGGFKAGWRHPWAAPMGALLLALLVTALAPRGSLNGEAAASGAGESRVAGDAGGVQTLPSAGQSLLAQLERIAQALERVQGPRVEWIALERLGPDQIRLEVRVGAPRLAVASTEVSKESAGERLQTALSGLAGVSDVIVLNRTGDEASMSLKLLQPLPTGELAVALLPELARVHAVAFEPVEMEPPQRQGRAGQSAQAWSLQAPVQPAERLLGFMPQLLGYGFEWSRLVIAREADGLASLRMEGSSVASAGVAPAAPAARAAPDERGARP